MRYQNSFSAHFSSTRFSFRIEGDDPRNAILVCVFSDSGQYLSPSTLQQLLDGEDDKAVISPEDISSLIQRLLKLEYPSVDNDHRQRRIALFEDCPDQIELHLTQSWAAVRIGFLSESSLIVSSTAHTETKVIAPIELPQFLFDSVITA